MNTKLTSEDMEVLMSALDAYQQIDGLSSFMGGGSWDGFDR